MSKTEITPRKDRLRKIRHNTKSVEALLIELGKISRAEGWQPKPPISDGFSALYYLDRLARKAP